jgi:hypothetical protein
MTIITQIHSSKRTILKPTQKILILLTLSNYSTMKSLRQSLKITCQTIEKIFIRQRVRYLCFSHKA